MNDALMKMGMITATVKHYITTTQWIDMCEDKYSSVIFIDDNDEETYCVKDWMFHLIREDLCYIYIVSEQKKGGFKDEDNPNKLLWRGIVVVYKKKISLWVSYSDYDVETKEPYIIFKEFPMLA